MKSTKKEENHKLELDSRPRTRASNENGRTTMAMRGGCGDGNETVMRSLPNTESKTMESETLRLELVSKGTIKPSKPTPEQQRTLNLSLLDQFSPRVYVRIIFFYLNGELKPKELKKSLSESLSYYYPFAGRIRMDGSIECNDEGVRFIEAHARCKLSHVLMKPQVEKMTHLCPISGEESLNGSEIDSMVLIQMTTFECGGIAIATCFSHKMADAQSIATFMKDWASINRDPSIVLSPPQFSGASLFPFPFPFPVNDNNKTTSSKPMSANANCSTRRFVFDASEIDSLKTMAKVLHPTRFEVISALIFKCILSASKSLGIIPQPDILNVIVNIRKRMKPPLSEHHIGNFALHNLVKVGGGDKEPELHTLVGLLKEGMDEFSKKKFNEEDTAYRRSAKIHECYNELEQLPSIKQGHMLLFSGWCRFPFYEVDFGFGKPAWVSTLPSPTKNCIFLCDTAIGNGIEAWVTLENQVMAKFECDQELLTFATPNPSPLKIKGEDC
ncbi:hypothetical protein Dimus_009802 [Dionaea muscipula]